MSVEPAAEGGAGTGRPRRTRREVDKARRRILAAALELFDTLGYAEVSMRKVAARAGCSPSSIYNYYRNKDALYLEVLKTGFETLLESLRGAVDADHPAESLLEIARRFYGFSRDYPSYYDLMFTLSVPKYLDYVGTDMEETAREEKAVAVANLRLAEELLRTGVEKGVFRSDLDPAEAALTLLAIAHGLVSLHRSGVLAEVDVDLEQAYFSVMARVIERLVNL